MKSRLKCAGCDAETFLHRMNKNFKERGRKYFKLTNYIHNDMLDDWRKSGSLKDSCKSFRYTE